ncbi:MAG: aldo/keto reductase [Desulfofustis sp.]|nr:aldo/keto reductase [Desulfofustis sp.]
MNYANLGKTGVKVSRLCFGTMSFGAEADEEMSTRLFHRCREAGINFFDCADVYSNGVAEEILGRLMADCRDEIVLTTKVHGAMGEDVNTRGLSRRYIVCAVEESLRRLKTDRIDVYYAHRFDAETDLEQTLYAFDDLVRTGKILYLAVSNWAAYQIATALGISRKEKISEIVCMQPMYNLVKRQAEVELLPLAEQENLAVTPYSPLGGGLLTGKYGVGRKPEKGRLVDVGFYSKRYSLEQYYQTADNLCAHARERGVNPATLGVAWVMTHPAVTAPIIGARNLEQLETSLAAAELDMTPEWRAEISCLSPAPAVATDRLEETF